MKKGKSTKTKFIATVSEKEINLVDKIAKDLKNDGNKIEKVSSMFGIINGKSDSSLEELKARYQSRGISIEPDGEVGI